MLVNFRELKFEFCSKFELQNFPSWDFDKDTLDMEQVCYWYVRFKTLVSYRRTNFH